MQFAYITLRLHCAAAAALRRRRVPAGRPRSQPPEPLDLGLDRDMQWSGRSDSCMSSRPVVSETLQLPAALGAHAARVEIVLVHEADQAQVPPASRSSSFTRQIGHGCAGSVSPSARLAAAPGGGGQLKLRQLRASG